METRNPVNQTTIPQEMLGALEALLLTSQEPLSIERLREIFVRAWSDREGGVQRLSVMLKEALEALKMRWNDSAERGFLLVEIAEGYAFRSRIEHAPVLLALKEDRPMRLSQPALETLAIVAYKQPITKAETDEIRGVDCSGTLHLLLDRHLIRIVGKKEEPGRPLLYGTTKEFLDFFNLKNLAHLPTLREFQELNVDSQEQLNLLEGVGLLDDMQKQAVFMQPDDDGVTQTLDEALEALAAKERQVQL